MRAWNRATALALTTSLLGATGAVLAQSQSTLNVVEVVGLVAPPASAAAKLGASVPEEELDAVLRGEAPLERGKELLLANRALAARVVAARDRQIAGRLYRNIRAAALLLLIDEPGARLVIREELCREPQWEDVVGTLRALGSLPPGFVDALLTDPDARVRAKGAWLLRDTPGANDRLVELLRGPAVGNERDAYAAALLHSTGVTVEQASLAVTHIETLAGQGVEWNPVLGAAALYAQTCPDEALARRAALLTFAPGRGSGLPQTFDRWVLKRDRWAEPYLKKLAAEASEPVTREWAWLRLAFLLRSELLDELVRAGDGGLPGNWDRVIALAAEGTYDARAVAMVRKRLHPGADRRSLEWTSHVAALDVLIRVCGSHSRQELGSLAADLTDPQRAQIRWYENGWTAAKAMAHTLNAGPRGRFRVSPPPRIPSLFPLLADEKAVFQSQLVEEGIVLPLLSGGPRPVLSAESLKHLQEMSDGALNVAWSRAFTVFVFTNPRHDFEFSANGRTYRVEGRSDQPGAECAALVRAANMALANSGVDERFHLYAAPLCPGTLFGNPAAVATWAEELGLGVWLPKQP